MNALTDIFYFNPFALLPLVTSLVALSLGIFIYSKDQKNPLNQAFLLWSLPLFGWLFSYSLNYFSKDPHLALVFIRWGAYLSIFIPIGQYNLNLKFLSKRDEHKFIPLSLLIALALGPFILLSDHFLYGPRQFPFGFYGIAGSYYIYFVTLFFIFSLKSFTLLWDSLKETERDAQSKMKIKYLLISFLIAYIGSIDFLPKFGVNVYPLGAIFIFLWVLLFAYIIFKYKIFNLSLVLERSIVYSLLIACLSLGYLITVLGMENILQRFWGYQSVSLRLIFAFLIGILVIPLRNRIQYILDRTLFKGTQSELAAENTLLRQEVTDKEKFKEVAVIASSLVHEVKNAITPVKTFLEFFPQKKDDPEFIEKFRRIATQELERTEGLTRQLLDFAKPSTPVFKQANIHELLVDTLILVERSLQQKGISLKSNFSSNGVWLNIDPQQIKQALLNILKNAVEVMGEGGTLRIQTSAKGGSASGGKDRRPKTNSLEISIEDTGPGIAPEDLKHLFEPFYSKKQGGTGLGLAITKDIIERHGGKIRIESKLGEGTRFILELPVHKT